MRVLNGLDIKCSSSAILDESWDYILTINESIEYNLSIYIDPYPCHRDDLYMKVFNAPCFEKATKCSRIKIFKAMYKKCDDNPMGDFILDKDDKLHLIEMLSSNACLDWTPKRTIWERMIYGFIDCAEGEYIKKLLKKRINKMPDYTKLPDHI